MMAWLSAGFTSLICLRRRTLLEATNIITPYCEVV